MPGADRAAMKRACSPARSFMAALIGNNLLPQ